MMGSVIFSAPTLGSGLSYYMCPEIMAFKRQLEFQMFWEPSNHQMGTFPFTHSYQRDQGFFFLGLECVAYLNSWSLSSLVL